MPRTRCQPYVIRGATAADAAGVCAIYNHYVARTVATFEESPVTVPEMARRIDATLAKWPWLVAETDGTVTGFAYATQWKSRSAYRYTVESTVYLAHACIGSGLGFVLYKSLIEALQSRGAHAAVACIALPNPASVALHEKSGFRKVAHFPESGFKFNRWIDVGYWQRVF